MTSSNASTFAFDGNGPGTKERAGEYWTGPPIVELISSTGGSGGADCQTEGDGDNDDDDDHDQPRFVRVTLQGIPSVFWKEEEWRDDMVPVSLVFEACFEPGKGKRV